MTVQDILTAASQLSYQERLQVAIRLLESLTQANPQPTRRHFPVPALAGKAKTLGDAEQAQKNQAAINLLDSWLDDTEDASEHQQAWDFLKTALDEDRLSDRPLFP